MKMWTVVRKNVKTKTWNAIVPIHRSPNEMIPAYATTWFRRVDAKEWLNSKKYKIPTWVVKPLALK